MNHALNEDHPSEPQCALSPIQTAAEVLKPLKPGGRLVGLTKGQFSVTDLLQAVLNRMRFTDVSLSTWMAGVKHINIIHDLVAVGELDDLSLGMSDLDVDLGFDGLYDT